MPENEIIKDLTPLRAIRLHCKECAAGHPKQIRYCGVTGCWLYIYRFGHNPKRKGAKGPRIPPFLRKREAHGGISETKEV